MEPEKVENKAQVPKGWKYEVQVPEDWKHINWSSSFNTITATTMTITYDANITSSSEVLDYTMEPVERLIPDLGD